MIKLVAFDWNGTLFADTYAIYQADNAVLKFLKQKPVSFSNFLKHFNVPVKKYYIALGLPEKLVEEKAEEIQEVFHEFYEKRINKIRTRSNTKTVLKWLADQKIPAVIISNHIKERINKQLIRLKLSGYFDEVLGNYSKVSAMHGRTKEKRLLEYLSTRKITPKNILIVGDAVEEVEVGKQIGALSVAITHGNVSTSRLKAAKPDYLISDLGNLINIIREINS